jgi:hypothetical protein
MVCKDSSECQWVIQGIACLDSNLDSDIPISTWVRNKECLADRKVEVVEEESQSDNPTQTQTRKAKIKTSRTAKVT